jgi:ABC-type glycerol-3-phosphate transport system permease component
MMRRSSTRPHGTVCVRTDREGFPIGSTALMALAPAILMTLFAQEYVVRGLRV